MTIIPTYKVYIDSEFKEAVEWTWNVFASYAGIDSEFTDDVSNSNLKIGNATSSTVVLIDQFWNAVENNDFSDQLLDDNMFVVLEERIDILATAFYFLNCLWERRVNQKEDEWGRSTFENSIWKKHGYDKPFIHVNQVFGQLADSLGLKVKVKSTEVFLSHDIDAVYSAWKEDGKAALQKGKLGGFVRLITSKIVNKSTWFNFKKIVNLETKFNASSTFFWIPSQKKIPGIGKNADYNLNSDLLKNELKELTSMGASHGIHKSIDSTSLKDEIKKIPFDVNANRYHYLKYSFAELINEMNESGLKMDASLGYAEEIGYRNGYSLPFSPFDFQNKKASLFIEVPLTVMDATLSRYKKLDEEAASKEIIQFIEEHKNNSVISILWHNTHFTDYKYAGYPQVYKTILSFLSENGIKSVSPNFLIKKYL